MTGKIDRCPTCGSAVEVVRSRGGTCHYDPVSDAALRESLECPICYGTEHVSGKECICGGTNDVREAFDNLQVESARIATELNAAEEVVEVAQRGPDMAPLLRRETIRRLRERLKQKEKDFQECFAAKESWRKAHDAVRERLEAAEEVVGAAREFHDSLVAPVAMHERELKALHRFREVFHSYEEAKGE